SSLGLLADDVHLKEGVDRASGLHPQLIDRVGQPRAVEGVQKLEARQVFHLVALKVSNQVPPHRASNDIHLGEGFLHSVLADVSEPRFPRRLYGVGTMRLGYSDDRYLLPVTTASHCRFDSVSDFSQPVREVRKRHNEPSYRRLQSESREE